MPQTRLKITLTCLSLALIAGCQTTQTPEHTTQYKTRLAVAPVQTHMSGAQKKSQKALQRDMSRYERAFARGKRDEMTVAGYARTLRQLGLLDRANAIVKNHLETSETPSAPITNERAAIALASNDYFNAAKYARQAIAIDENYFNAYQTLGRALDGSEQWEDAESVYRKGIEIWQGDNIDIRTDLALNLTAQEKLAEGLSILEGIKKQAPHRMDVERNLRIVRALYNASPKSQTNKNE